MDLGFLRVAAGATPIRVADCAYNRAQIVDAALHYAKSGVEVIFFPQLCITGYTCGDLFLQKTLIDSAVTSLLYIAQATKACTILSFVGLPYLHEGKLYNCMAAVYAGKVLGLVPTAYQQAPLEQNARYFAKWQGDNVSISLNGCDIVFGAKQLFTPINHSAKIACAAVQAADAGMLCTDYARAGANIIGACAAYAQSAEQPLLRSAQICAESARLYCAIASTCPGEGESTTDCVYSGSSYLADCGTAVSESPLFSRSFAVGDIDTELIDAERTRAGFELASMHYTKTTLTLPLKSFSPIAKLRQNPYLPKNAQNFADFYSCILTICAHALAKRMAHANAACAVIGISGGLDSCLALLTVVKAFKLLNLPAERVCAISMPCFGTSERTKINSEKLCKAIGVELQEINIENSVSSHFSDINHSAESHDITYENAQARMRTLVLMDMANKNGGIVIGTGDLSELALGWATYGGDHMSMYGVNAGIPKTMIRLLTSYIAENSSDELKQAINDILATPVSPELLPLQDGDISQKTEDIVGPYELHDFFIYYAIRCGFTPKKVFFLAANAFNGAYEKRIILKWLHSFYSRFFAGQFKRSCMPDAPMALGFSLSPRGGLMMPSDAVANLWKEDLISLEKEI